LLKAVDTAVFYFINNTCSNRFFDIVMPWLTQLGEWEVLLSIALLVFLLRKKEAKVSGIYLSVGLLAAYWTVFFLKIWFARPRPFVALSGVHLLAHAGRFSFPSGHATDIFLAATVLSLALKKPFALYLIAAGVAFSRIYLGVHYPSDTIAGALIGVALGKGMIWAGNIVRKHVGEV